MILAVGTLNTFFFLFSLWVDPIPCCYKDPPSSDVHLRHLLAFVDVITMKCYTSARQILQAMYPK
jgi:hypothetical protein